MKEWIENWIENVNLRIGRDVERQKEAQRGGCMLSWDHLSRRRGGGGWRREGGHTTPQTALPAHKRVFEKWLKRAKIGFKKWLKNKGGGGEGVTRHRRLLCLHIRGVLRNG